MQMSAFLNFLQSSWLATLLDGSRYIAMTVQIVHILGFTFLLALVLAFNLRVLRLALRTLAVGHMARALERPFLITLLVAVIAGSLLFLPRANTYAANAPFVWKMALLLGASAIQILLLRTATARVPRSARVQQAGSGAYQPPVAQAYPTLVYHAAWNAPAGTLNTSALPAQDLAHDVETSWLFRAAALLALLLWLGTGVAGRVIGFV